MNSVLEQKCPNCGAMMRFDPNRQLLTCDYCDTNIKFDTETMPAEDLSTDFQFEDFQAGYEQPDAASLPIYFCKSCSAELIAPPEQMALTCPYCRNNIVLTDKVSGKLRPNGILPFRITPEQLPKLMNKFYGKMMLLPKNYFTEATMTGITGVYVPFWLFSGSIWGDGVFVGTQSATEMRPVPEGEMKITTTTHYEIRSAVSMSFSDIPVDASQRIDDSLMDALEPFDITQVKPFDTAYLAGFTADRFDAPSEAMKHRARIRVTNTADSMMASRIHGFENVRRVGGALDTNLTAKYYLLPVYLFKMQYAGKEYEYAVNGQTGKVVGELPEFKAEGRTYFLKRFLPAVGAILGFFVVKYFLGG